MLNQESAEKLKQYQKLLGMSYDEAFKSLIKKYGVVKDDYFKEQSYKKFLNQEIKTPTKGKFSDTIRGLYTHHVMENRGIMMSTPAYILLFEYPFKWQQSDQLVYCDLIEHLILHVLIACENPNPIILDANPNSPLFNKLLSHENQVEIQVGLGGYENFLRPQVIEWYITGINGELRSPNQNWRKNCYEKSFLEVNDAKKILSDADSKLEKVFD